MAARDSQAAHLKAAQQAGRAGAEPTARAETYETLRAKRRLDARHAAQRQGFARYYRLLHGRRRWTVAVDDRKALHGAWFVDRSPIPVDRQQLDYWTRAGWVTWHELDEIGLRRYEITDAGWLVLDTKPRLR